MASLQSGICLNICQIGVEFNGGASRLEAGPSFSRERRREERVAKP
tara:strand:- start:6055 stop:6192 length:138 start_codon:yes stop_codon:yes gene_type:complete